MKRLRLSPRSLLLAAAACAAGTTVMAQSTPVQPSATAPTQTAQSSSSGGTGGASSSSGGSMFGSPYSSDSYSLLPYTRRGYVSINLGESKYKLACPAATPDCDDSQFAGHIATGGLFNDFIGAEIGYVNMGNLERGLGTELRAQGVNLSLVGRVPMGQFNVFAKAGATYGRTRTAGPLPVGVTDDTEDGWGPSYGAGVGFDFTPQSGVVLEWGRHEFHFAGVPDRESVEAATVGYVHRF